MDRAPRVRIPPAQPNRSVFAVLLSPLLVPWPGYRTLLGVGLAGALLVTLARSRRWRVPPLVGVDGLLAAAVGGVIAGRIGYVVANWAYFRDHFPQALQVWRGGLSAHGALLGALGAAVLLARWRRIDPRLLLDLLAPAAALVAGCAWLGCLWAGCAPGIEVRPDQGLLWRLSAELPDLYGLRTPRVAVQLLGAGWSSLAFLATLGVGRRGRPFPLWLFLHGVGGFGLGFLRSDLSPGWMGVSSSQMVDLAMALVGLILVVLPGWRSKGESNDRV